MTHKTGPLVISHISHPDFAVIGIGASAGGVQALLRLFEATPQSTGVAFVVVLHLSPDHASHAQEVLQGVTRLKVTQISRPVPLARDNIYVIPPGKHISMVDGYLRLSDPEPPRLPPTSIDVFFRSLADAHGARAISVVLSGTGSDGSLGIARVRECGGITVAQQPEEAEYGEMPRNAIATGDVDLVLPVSEIVPKLLDLIRNAAEIRLPASSDQDEAATEPDPVDNDLGMLDDVLEILRQRTLHDFAFYKRGTIARRIERRMQVCGIPTVASYRDFLAGHVDETPLLLADLLIGVTNFFRDPEAFTSLEGTLLATFPKRLEGVDEVRAWVPACATGEEAFSVAIVLDEVARRLPHHPRVTVYASDIDERAIAIARTGNYPGAIANDISPVRLAQYFVKEGDRYRVVKSLRDTVVFAAHNLLRDPPFSRLDLISCRNLLIYLDRRAQSRVLDAFHFSLRSHGFLFLGAAESADFASEFFTPVDKHKKIYRALQNRSKAEMPAFGTVPLPPIVSGKSFFAQTPDLPSGVLRPPTQIHELDLFGPPTIVIRADGMIEHCSANANRLVEDVRHTRVGNLYDIVRVDARSSLREAIARCLASGRREDERAVPFETAASEVMVDLSLQKYSNPARAENMLMVTCDPLAPMTESSPFAIAPPEEETVDVLRRALAGSEERLRSSLQYAQSSTEELRASNEELQAMNEELRSASEELEASREELQSLNEELVTVNSELLAKVQESARVSDDLQNLISLVGVATIFVDRSLGIKRFTAPAETLFNILPGDRGRPLQHLTHRLDYPEMIEDLREAFESLHKAEREVNSDDGRCFLARVLPYRTDDDRIDGAVLALIDITQQKAAQDLARLSEEKLKLAAQTTHDFAIIVTDSEGMIVSWNVGATHIFGFTPEDALGSSLDQIFTSDDREKGVPAQEREKATKNGRAEDERWHVTRSGEQVFCSGFMSRIDVPGFSGFAKIVHDETQRKFADARKEVVLARERADLTEAKNLSRLKDEFMAVLSHELKNPLNLIAMKAEMLARLPEARHIRRVQEVADAVHRSVVTQAQIIDDLLDFSRVQTGKLSLRFARTDITAIVRSIAQSMQADMERAGIELRLELPGDPVLIHGDAIRIEQIAWNLLTNALKFTPKAGMVVVQLRLEQGLVRLDVTDTGIGVAPETLGSIFDMFVQVPVAGQRARSPGLGIGLSLVRQLAQLHGGTAEAFSEGKDRGTRFTIRFPVDASFVYREAGDAPVDLSLFQNLRILLVEDSADSLAAMTDLLSMRRM
nr:Histidine protein kinase DivJ [Paraburkholderia busanensis]